MIRFEQIEYLWILPLWLAFWYFIFRQRKVQIEKTNIHFKRLGSQNWLPSLHKKNLHFSWILWAAIGILIILALSNPQWGSKAIEGAKNSSDIVIALDISNSMFCKDIPPSRIDAAKEFAKKLIEKEAGNRIGLVYFAGAAIIQMPLTDDIDAVSLFLENASPEQLLTQGSDIGQALNLSIEVLGEQNPSGKAIVLISDGEDHDSNAEDAASTAKNSGIQVHAVGFGTQEGGHIEMNDQFGSNIKLDENGQEVVTKINDKSLKKIANEGGGLYLSGDDFESSLDQLDKKLKGLDKVEGNATTYTIKESYFAWFLLLALFLLIIDFLVHNGVWKPKWLLSIGIMMLLQPSMVKSQTQHSELRNGDKAYFKQQLESAEKNYSNASKGDDQQKKAKALYNQGTTNYNLGRFEEASKNYDQVDKTKLSPNENQNLWYNKGNIHFQNKEYQKAIDHYKNALKINPNDFDAKINLALANRKLKENEKKQNEQKNQNNTPQNNNPNDQNQNPGNQNPGNQNKSDQNQENQNAKDQKISNPTKDPNGQSNNPSSANQLPEQTKQMLKIIEEEERKTQQKIKRQNPTIPRSKGKDW